MPIDSPTNVIMKGFEDSNHDLHQWGEARVSLGLGLCMAPHKSESPIYMIKKNTSNYVCYGSNVVAPKKFTCETMHEISEEK